MPTENDVTNNFYFRTTKLYNRTDKFKVSGPSIKPMSVINAN
jgi:hypothetical protein